MDKIEAPTLFTFWGTGSRFIGRRDVQRDGSYTTTVWLCILFIPILPGGSFRVIERATSNIWVPGVFSQSKTNYAIIGTANAGAKHIAIVYSISVTVIAALIYMVSPRGPVPLDAASRAAAQLAITNFETPRLGRLIGKENPASGGGVADKRMMELGLRLVRGEPKGSLPNWLISSEEWTLRGQGGCAMQCMAVPSCVGFEVSTYSSEQYCRTFSSIKDTIILRPEGLYSNSWFAQKLKK